MPHPRYPNPIPGSYMTSPFGRRVHPVTGSESFHSGLDLGKRCRDKVTGKVRIADGAPIYAPAPGRVVYVNNDDSMAEGYAVGIKHDDGYYTSYSHLQERPRFIVGNRVAKGQVVGLLGKSGRVTGTHLHFVVKDRSGRRIDPVLLIGQPPSRSTVLARGVPDCGDYGTAGTLAKMLTVAAVAGGWWLYNKNKKKGR